CSATRPPAPAPTPTGSSPPRRPCEWLGSRPGALNAAPFPQGRRASDRPLGACAIVPVSHISGDMQNHLRTFMLLAAMTALFVGVGYLIGGPTGMAIALAIGVAMNFFSYWNSDKIVLRMYGAREVDPSVSEPLLRNYVADVYE